MNENIPPKPEDNNQSQENGTPPMPDAPMTTGVEKNIEAENMKTEAPKIDAIPKTQKPPKKMIGIVVGIVILLIFIAIFGVMGYFFMQDETDRGDKWRQTDTESSDEIESDNKSNTVSRKGLGASDCQLEYEKLLSVNEFDFDQYCTNQNIRSGNYEGNQIPEKSRNLVLIFDASGSMAAQIDGKRKIDIAKEAAWKFIDQIDDENLNLSIVVYGHKGSNSVSQKSLSCAGIEEVYFLGEVNAEVAKSKLNAFDATGWTPIAGSLKKAQEILAQNPNDDNFILLVSDGKEMCDGDPVATINELKKTGLNVKADVIGFDVGGADEAQLKAIAQAGGGDYFSAKSVYDLENAFAKHKEMLNKVDFKIGRTIEQLYDISFVINNYNQCRSMLHKEEAAMMLDIHASKLVGKKCEDFADGEYKKRYTTIKNQIKTIYDKDKAKFNSLK